MLTHVPSGKPLKCEWFLLIGEKLKAEKVFYLIAVGCQSPISILIYLLKLKHTPRNTCSPLCQSWAVRQTEQSCARGAFILLCSSSVTCTIGTLSQNDILSPSGELIPAQWGVLSLAQPRVDTTHPRGSLSSPYWDFCLNAGHMHLIMALCPKASWCELSLNTLTFLLQAFAAELSYNAAESHSGILTAVTGSCCFPCRM